MGFIHDFWISSNASVKYILDYDHTHVHHSTTTQQTQQVQSHSVQIHFKFKAPKEPYYSPFSFPLPPSPPSSLCSQPLLACPGSIGVSTQVVRLCREPKGNGHNDADKADDIEHHAKVRGGQLHQEGLGVHVEKGVSTTVRRTKEVMTGGRTSLLHLQYTSL